MYLADFKDGLEFNRYIGESQKNWLPHAKTITLEGDPVLGISILRYLEKQRTSRSKRFKETKVSDYSGYRSKGYMDMPRILVVMDELQTLFEGSDDSANEAVRLLNVVARKGRVAGIHVILSTQTLSGIHRLQSKASSIFDQFNIRISLENTQEGSEAILGPHNTAASILEKPGDIIVNKKTGMNPDDNIRGRVARLDFKSNEFEKLQKELWELGGGIEQQRPRVFNGSKPAQWNQEESRKLDSRELMLGVESDIENTPIKHQFEENISQSLLVAGRDKSDGECTIHNILGSAIRSAVENDSYRRLICIEPEKTRWMKDYAKQCGFQGIVEQVASKEATRWLALRGGFNTREVAGSD